MQELTYYERAARGQADGLLILHHGRGGDESQLRDLAEALDRVHRLHVFLPRAPLSLPRRSGYHWFTVKEIGHPEPESFQAGYCRLGAFHDWVWQRCGIPPEQTVLGGVSMGCAMSYATGLGADRPRPAGILAFSGPIPTVEGWLPDLAARRGLPVLIGHGRTDRVVRVQFAHRARALLEDAGLDVTYRETGGGHSIDERTVGDAIQWLSGVL